MKEMYKMLSKSVSDQYLQLLFGFYATDSKDWFKDYFAKSEIRLLDKIGILLRYLPSEICDRELKNLKRKAMEEGDISGILITGFSNDSYEILINYIDQTNDIQTAAIIAAFIDIFNGNENINKDLERIMKSYEDLLCSFNLLEEKCNFVAQRLLAKKAFLGDRIILEESKIKSFTSTTSMQNTPNYSPKQAYNMPNPFQKKTCNLCGKNYDPQANLQPQENLTGIDFCVNCKNLLSRCSICQISLGNNIQEKSLNNEKNEEEKWFVWCEKCRHGGHFKHVREWFEKNKECPVANCFCECYNNENL